MAYQRNRSRDVTVCRCSTSSRRSFPGWPQLGCSRLPTRCTANKARRAVGKLGLRGVSLSLGCSADSEFDSYRHGAELLNGLIRRAERVSVRCGAPTASGTQVNAHPHNPQRADNPQSRYPVVHVTGTSGVLNGLSGRRNPDRGWLSSRTPHVSVPASRYRKLQLGPSLIDACSFADLVSRVLDTAARLFPPEHTEPAISYGEVWSVLGFWWLRTSGRYRRRGGGSRRAVRCHQRH